MAQVQAQVQTRPGAQAKLEIIDVHKRFRDKVVLNGIDLAVDEHEVICLIGPSGCGKSTLLRCIDLLEPIDSGTIKLNSSHQHDENGSPQSVRARMGMVFQAYNLFPHMTVLNNVTLAAVRVHRQSRGEAEAKAMELLGRFGLGDKASDYPDRISGGQQQRVAVVRALMGDPELLLLDEITSALDPELVGEVLSIIRELADGGMTMILATHEMGFAKEVASRVAFLHEGKVLECAPPAELFGDPQADRTKRFLTRVTQAGRL